MADAMVHLLLLRHGLAEERRADRPEALRPLTPEGIRRTRAVVGRLAELDLRVDRLVTSPLARARQTAALALEAGLAPSLEEHTALEPGGAGLAGLHAHLADLPGEGRLMLVGHEPDLGDLAARLIGAAPGSLVLKKAGLAWLQAPSVNREVPWESPWRLRLLIGPRQLLGT
ncbi:phosphohistidine phosphatase SixA [Cyanobium sp. PCC 7001]|uniref:SixA phosphatase family protein n=1 Tax=Cyanobium sp. PCC 7001 TaxID=180281 RepID=UPI0001805D6B|nr:histidine phosphatase family protein [Cyanobium sp. PCC 7001]EDY37334.1 phosphohistidine phosphatase SixA [Cyanobium sp. PCC 7001]